MSPADPCPVGARLGAALALAAARAAGPSLAATLALPPERALARDRTERAYARHLAGCPRCREVGP